MTSTKKNDFVNLPPTIFAKMSNKSMFKNNSIRKHVNFQGPSLFCVDVKNICSPRHFQIITPLLKKFSYKNSHLEQFNTMFKLGSNLLRRQISITFFNLLRYEFFFC